MNAPYNRRVGPFRRYFFAIASVALAIAVLELLGPTVNGAAAAQILLLVLIIDARFCGTGPAIVGSLCAAAGFTFVWSFVPRRRFRFVQRRAA